MAIIFGGKDMLGAGVRLPGGLSLRPANDGDAGFLASLYSSTRDDLRILPDRDLAECLIELQFRAQTESYGTDFPEAMHFVVGLHDDRIGRLILDFSRGTVHIVDISFIPAARGHGYGQTLIQAVQSVAQQINTPVSLSVASDRVDLARFYAQFGFQLDGQSAPAHARMVWYPQAARRSAS